MATRPQRIPRLHLPVVCSLLLSVASPAFAQGAPPASPTATAATAADRAAANKRSVEGDKLARAKDYKGALEAYTEANRLHPAVKSLRAIAEMHERLEDPASAFAAYESLVQTYPNQRAEVARAEKKLEALRSATGILRIEISDDDATVTIGERELGTLAAAGKSVRLNPGTYVVRAAKPSMVTLSREVTIAAGEETVFEGTLEQERGRLAVRGEGDVIVSLNGQEVGPLPWEGELPPGEHTVSGKGSALFFPERSVEVKPGETTELSVAPEPIMTVLSVRATDPLAELTVDGRPVGRGAWTGPVPVGQREIIATVPGSAPVRQAIIAVSGDNPELVLEVAPVRDEGVQDAARRERFDWFTVVVKGGISHYGETEYETNGITVQGKSRSAPTVQLSFDLGADAFAFELAPYLALDDYMTAGLFFGPVYRFKLGDVYPSVGLGIKGGYMLGSNVDTGVEAYGRIPIGVTYYPIESLGLVAEVGGGYGAMGIKGTGATDLSFGTGLLVDAMAGIRFP